MNRMLNIVKWTYFIMAIAWFIKSFITGFTDDMLTAGIMIVLFWISDHEIRLNHFDERAETQSNYNHYTLGKVLSLEEEQEVLKQNNQEPFR